MMSDSPPDISSRDSLKRKKKSVEKPHKCPTCGSVRLHLIDFCNTWFFFMSIYFLVDDFFQE